MDTVGWTIRFVGYLPIDHQMEDRLRRVMADIANVPDSAISVDEQERVVTIDYGQVKDWFEQARTVIKPLKVGKRIVVTPPWEEYQPADGEIVITIDAGPIFGTGMHETTALCVQALENYLRPGYAVVDFGAGSGILAIAAAKLGASRVVAIEADVEAVQIARDNVARNGVNDIVSVFKAMTPEVSDIQADLVVANIVPSVLIPNLEPLSRVMARDGKLILSGLNKKTCVEVEEALPGAGYSIMDKTTMGGWVALATTFAR